MDETQETTNHLIEDRPDLGQRSLESQSQKPAIKIKTFSNFGLVAALLFVLLVGAILYFALPKILPGVAKSPFSTKYFKFTPPKNWSFSGENVVAGKDEKNEQRTLTIKNYVNSKKPEELEQVRKYAARDDIIKEKYISRTVGSARCQPKAPTCTKEVIIFDKDLSVHRSALVVIVWDQLDQATVIKELDKRFHSVGDPNAKVSQMNSFLQEQSLMDPAERDFEKELFSDFQFTKLDPGSLEIKINS